MAQPHPRDLDDTALTELVYVTIAPEHAEALEELERISFPTVAPRELTSVATIHMQCDRFPEGGFVVMDGDRIVGFAMGVFVDFDLDDFQHHIDEAVGPTGAEFHDPNGTWYYGTDIVVHPDYRGRGIGRRLYELRKELVRLYNRAGIIAGGVIPGFADHKHEMSADEYVRRVAAEELYDPTLSFQLANGFEARGAIAGYMKDEAVDDHASFIVWHNPEHDPEALERARHD
ncbi:MAG: GNAT family N-acetyltransferase [Acidimicrobiia bacterium]|nr:GNAT family N-acetyltransferase [Acidimicrobiia bacterium]